MLFWMIAGLVSGALLGITGSGGAIGAIPFFVYGLGINIKDATTLSLYPVLIGALVNWWIQRRDAHTALSLTTALLSFASTAYFVPIKAQTSKQTIQAIFLIFCALSLWGVWKKKTEKEPSTQNEPTQPKRQYSPESILKVILLAGLLGMTITMAGTGGGIFLVPIYAAGLGLSLKESVASSLLTIWIAATGSLYSQRERLSAVTEPHEVLALSFGILVAALLVKKLSSKIEPRLFDRLRKALFTIAVLSAMISVIRSPH